MIVRSILISSLVLLTLVCQGQWRIISSEVNDFDFSSVDTGYVSKGAYGYAGNERLNSIYKTTDRGNTWNKAYSTYMLAYMKPIYSRWQDTCYYCEEGYGNLYRSSNGGTNWARFQVTDVALADITFLSSEVAYITTNKAGSNFLRRIDKNNSTKLISTDTIEFHSVCFISDSIGFFICEKDDEYSIYRSISPNSSGTRVYKSFTKLNDIVFSTDSVGFVVGDHGLILKTIDQGKTWHKINTPTLSNLKYLDVLNNEKIFCAGDNGTILKSNDSGDHWSIVFFDFNEPLEKIRAFDNSTAYVLSKNKVLYANENIVGQKSNPMDHQQCKFHPNPFCNTIFLTDISPGPASIKIHSIDGRIVFQKENFTDDKLQIRTSDWQRGIYLVTLTIDEYFSSFKMIK